MKFNKPAKTFTEQLDLLMERGMQVPNREQALSALAHISYYRLAAYWLPFESSRAPHRFKESTTFDQVLTRYDFDRALRLHLLDAIERLEISFRTQWAYHMSLNYGPHGYTQNTQGLRKKESRLKQDLEELCKHIERSDEIFIKHYTAKYDEKLPPAWVSCEVMSLGLLSRLYSNLRAYKVRQAIAATYQVDESFLEGFLEHLTYVRNVCAHHNRLWNRHLTKKMPLPKGKPAGLRDNIHIDPEHKTEHRIYNTLVMIQHFKHITCPASRWAVKLNQLIQDHHINVQPMGFPTDWQSLPLWQEALKTASAQKQHNNNKNG